MNDKTPRTSVLSTLTAEVMAEKKAEARKLSPVAGERGHMPMANALIPNDTGVFLSNEALHDHAKQLRKFAADAIAIADGLDELVQEPSTPSEVVDLDAARKQKEAEADAKHANPLRLDNLDGTSGIVVTDLAKAAEDAEEKEAETAIDKLDEADFAADFAAKAKAAQDATFKPADLGWACPDHNKAIEKTSPKTGRTYVGCPDCNLFKR